MRRPSPLSTVAVALGIVVLALVRPAPAQTAEPVPVQSRDEGAADPASFDLVLEELDVRRSAAEADPGLPSDVKSLVLELFSRAIAERREAAATLAETAALAERIETAPQRIEELAARLDEPPVEPDPAVYAGLPLDELSARAQLSGQELAQAREALTGHEKSLADLNALGQTLSETIAAARLDLRELQQAEAEPASIDVPVAGVARAAYLAAREARLSATMAKADLELANYETLVRLATLERDAAALLVPRLDAEREALIRTLEERRADEARGARVEAQLAAVASASLPRAVAELAAEGARLGVELEAVTLDTTAIAEELRAAERRAGELEAELVSIQQRFRTVGATEAVGRILRRQLLSFDGVETSRARASARADAILAATERRLDLGDRRRELADVGAREEEILAAIPESERAQLDEGALRAEIARIVATNRATIDELHAAYGRYLTRLSSHDAAERHLATTSQATLDFIRRELLWIRSLHPVSVADVSVVAESLAELLDASTWRRALADAGRAAALRPVVSAIVLSAVLALLLLRPWARRRLVDLAGLTGRIRTDAFQHTVLALLLTALLAIGWAAPVASFAWLLRGVDDAAPFSYHVSESLQLVAVALAMFGGLRWVLHPSGLGRQHFGWPEAIRVEILREVRWLMPITIAGVTLWVYASHAGVDDFPVGRYALMIFSAALCVFVWRVFRRGGALMSVGRARYADGIGTRTWAIWFPVLLAVPAANFVAAGAGYAYTARVIVRLFLETGFLVVGVWILRDMLLRWFTVAERRLRFERALRLREEARAERERQQDADAAPHAPEIAEIEEPQVDLRELGDQGRAIVQGAVVLGVLLILWAMWGEVLPALDGLASLHLPVSRVTVVDGLEQPVPVTVADVAVALIVIAATLFAAKNLSGLLGFTLLRRLAMDAGAQYAIVTLCQYALVGAGLLFAFSVLGMQWSKLQWLVAALGVGLGFGLQEIVANFVSGIILLLERPVRVGDFVTVGNATGTVARIRIRATTILDLDMKELVVPNKEFVTGRLLNWTLSSDVIRVVVPVGVAYGSDARRARELMLDAASRCELVKDDPPPNVVFSSFGDNSLGLELRCYVSSMERYIPATTALHDAIYDAFGDAGIVISFPQRDVHLDTSRPLEIRMADEDASPAPPRPRWRGPGRRRGGR